jgi:adenine phosphoribosyltransferase
MALEELLRGLIRDVPDFPRKGIVFKDITPILETPEALQAITRTWADRYAGREIDVIAGIESRGFLFGAPLAYEMGLPFVLIRKPGKLPRDAVKAEYALEYGTDTVELHRDAISKGQRVLLIDDLLATGGTMEASARLVEMVGGEVAAIALVIELGFLEGRGKLEGHEVDALVVY